MQSLLEEFNKIDRHKQGSIRLAEALRLVQVSSKVGTVSEDTIQKVIFNVERQVSFD